MGLSLKFKITIAEREPRASARMQLEEATASWQWSLTILQAHLPSQKSLLV